MGPSRTSVAVLLCYLVFSSPFPALFSRSLFALSDDTPTTFIFLVGVEGVGHHGVMHFITDIARATGHSVFGADNYFRLQMWLSHYHHNPEQFQNLMTSYRGEGEFTAVLEHYSFPTMDENRLADFGGIKNDEHYDLEYYFKTLLPIKHLVKMKILYLTRDFYRTVSSHQNLDGGFTAHAKVLEKFTEHIYSEYKLIEALQPSTWRQIKYEWFEVPENCPRIVSAVVSFLNWTSGHEEEACQSILAAYRPPVEREMNMENFEYVLKNHQNVPIPLLGIDGLIEP